MADVKQLKDGEFGVFTIQNGVIKQVALTESKSEFLRLFLASISNEKDPLLLLPQEYDLTLKNQVQEQNNILISDFLENEKLMNCERQALESLMSTKRFINEITFVRLSRCRNIGELRAQKLYKRLMNYGKN